jgi:deoxycytidine triphosphate deaminase
MTEGVYHKGALLQVVNPFGLTMYKNAKLAQFVFHELKDKVCIFMLYSFLHVLGF